MTTLREAAEKAQPTTSAVGLLDSLISYAGSTLRTNSRDISDWVEDVHDMVKLAERVRAELAKPDARPAPAEPQPAAQEPVAFRCWHPKAERCYHLSTSLPEPFRSDTGEPDEYFGGKVEPLYTQAGERKPLTDAARAVLAERQRQVTAEGWSDEHDDEHDTAEMARAAACYAMAAAGIRFEWPLDTLWPWHHGWWKPHEPRRNLVKAGALILAEIERLDRGITATKGGRL